MPRFTIGIPTYNRAGHLPKALAAALGQSWPDVEVIVSDNASTDETPEIVRALGDRVRYHRNPENLGSWPNFVRVVELAEGEYFSWFQDDDLIHRDFVRRAIEALESSEDCGVFAAYSYYTPSANTFYLPSLLGPAVSLDWMSDGAPVLLDGLVVAPLSLFHSFANPPAVAFRTGVLRRALTHFDPGCPLYNERIVVAAAAAEGKVAVVPWAGAIFLCHEDQEHRRIFHQGDEVKWRQWAAMANALGGLLERQNDRWRAPLEQIFRDMTVDYRLRWLDSETPGPEVWRSVHPLAAQVREMLIASIPAEARTSIDRKPPSRLKTAIIEVVPPVALRGLRALRHLPLGRARSRAAAITETSLVNAT